MKSTLLILLTILPCLLAAQDSTQTTRQGSVSVETDPPGAEVFLDSVRIGNAPLKRSVTTSGTHALKVFFPSATAWNAFVKTDEIRVESGNDMNISYEFGSFFSIRSVPSGATVSHEGTDLGLTPLFFKSNTKLRGSLLLRKEQFEPTAISLADSSLTVFLRPLSGGKEPVQEVVLEQPDVANPRMWATYGSAAGMVTSGILAAYFKDRANRKFDLFLSTKNDSYLASTRRLDRQSAIALVITEISFAALSYFLFSD